MNASNPNQADPAVRQLRVAIVAVDVVLLSVIKGRLRVFLIPVHLPGHYEHMHGVPGGILLADETAEGAAARHLQVKLGITGLHIEQLHTFTDLSRDVRSRAIAISYLALIPAETLDASSGTVAGTWFPVDELPSLAFDHAQMVRVAVERLKGKLEYTTIVSTLLPAEFPLSQMQGLYELILGKALDKRNFRRKVIELDIVAPTGTRTSGVGRPAELYRFLVSEPVLSGMP